MPRQTIGRPRPRFFGVASKNRKVAPTANNAPAITSNGGGETASISIAENGTAVTTVVATNPNARTLVFYLTGVDAPLFKLDSVSGVLTFVNAPDFETPKDQFKKNAYRVIARVSDGIFDDSQIITVNVTNVNEAPVITSTNVIAMNEGLTAVMTCTATDPDASTVFTWSISGGLDAALFSIDAVTGALRFNTAPVYESPSDSNGDNTYLVTVQVSDGALTATMNITIGIGTATVQRTPVGYPQLAALNAAGKVISAWLLDPTAVGGSAKDLTLVGNQVQGWKAAMGSLPCDLAELTIPPIWKPNLFGGFGGVFFDGTKQLAGTANVASWPDASTPCWLISAIKPDVGSTGGTGLSYGGGSGVAPRTRSIGTSGIPLVAQLFYFAGNTFPGVTTVSGSCVVAGQCAPPSSTTNVYLNGVLDGSGVTTAGVTLTLTRATMGVAANLSAQRMFGSLVAAAVLSSSVTAAEIAALSAEFAQHV